MHSVLWRRLDQEGHDACRFSPTSDGWSIEGAAVFEHQGAAARIAYRLTCDRRWSSRRASVSGWVGARDIELTIDAGPGGEWSVNGVLLPALSGLEDIDLGFTPATNTNAIRRLDLRAGAEAATTAVWLDAEDWAVKPLPQTYLRRGENAYDYGSPTHDYRATLHVDDFGAIRRYPGLWVAALRGD